jgi:hypothetical protein
MPTKGARAKARPGGTGPPGDRKYNLVYERFGLSSLGWVRLSKT